MKYPGAGLNIFDYIFCFYDIFNINSMTKGQVIPLQLAEKSVFLFIYVCYMH